MGIMHIMILVGNHLTTQHKTLINQKICKTVKETLPRTMVPIVRQLLTSEVNPVFYVICTFFFIKSSFYFQNILKYSHDFSFKVSAKDHIILLPLHQGNQFSKQETLKLQVPHQQKHRIPKRR